MSKKNGSDESHASQLTRREAMERVALTGLGIATVLSGTDKVTSLAAQGAAPQVIPPDKDPRYPMPPSWPKELKQLAPNIYAYTQAGGPGVPSVGVSNPGMIAGPDYMWAIDGAQGPVPAKGFIAACKQATGKDFGRVLLTHHHGDHTGGLQFFQNAEVWSHPYCREEVLKAVPTTPKTWDPNFSYPYGKIVDVAEPRKLVVPMLTFDDDVTVFVGGTEVRFMYAGPAHTWGDMMAYLPKEKILFAGDVGFFWVAPFAQNGYVSKWIQTCDKIMGMDVDVIVPGHGPIGGKKELNEMADYFRTLTVEARKRYDAKMSPGAAAAEIRLGRFDNWIGTQLILTDTVRLYDEWDGSLTPDVDTGRTKEATLEYNQIKKAQGKMSEMIPVEGLEHRLARSC